MQATRTHRVLLLVSGLLATVISGALVLTPQAFYATNGIVLGPDANLLSEVRAPGANLLALGVLMFVGAFVAGLTRSATAVGALVYLSYGTGRLVSWALDGNPGDGLLVAMAIEIVMGMLCLVTLLRTLPGCHWRHPHQTAEAL